MINTQKPFWHDTDFDALLKALNRIIEANSYNSNQFIKPMVLDATVAIRELTPIVEWLKAYQSQDFERNKDWKIVPPNWVAIPMDPTEEQWITAQGTLLDYNWDAVTCFAARLQTLISITRNQLEDEIKVLNV